MKRFNRIIIVSVMVYLVLASAGGILLYFKQNEADRIYKVEINRIYHSLGDEYVKPDMGEYKYVKKVGFLPEGSSDPAVKEFFRALEELDTEIRPWYQHDIFKGFLRFDYVRADKDTGYTFLVSETALFLLEVYILILLFHLRVKLILPFKRMSELPYELAKGHLSGEVKEEKEAYFGDFMRGVGNLKDTLAVAKKRELELEKEKKMLLLTLSHDIKTPLNALKLYKKTLDEDVYETAKERRNALEQIEKKAEEIERYVEKIMEASRENILDIKVEEGEFYIQDLMEKVKKVYGEKCALHMTDLKVGECRNCLLRGDIERSFEVFGNIFENAFKYGDGRRIEITFPEEDGSQLIRIYNTGGAVSDNDMNHIFESFYRGADSSHKPGNGLGLYICREIMRRMDGEIYAEKCAGGMAFVLVYML